MTTEKSIEQANFYVIYDSMGRRTDIYLTASNIKEAYAKARKIVSNIVGSYYTIKRCYNGGVRGC